MDWEIGLLGTMNHQKNGFIYQVEQGFIIFFSYLMIFHSFTVTSVCSTLKNHQLCAKNEEKSLYQLASNPFFSIALPKPEIHVLFWIPTQSHSHSTKQQWNASGNVCFWVSEFLKQESAFHCCLLLCPIHHWYLVHACLAKTELFLNHVKLKLNRNTTPSPTTSCTLDRLVPLKSHWFLQIHLKNNDREAPVRGKKQLLVTQPLVTKFTKPVPNRHPSTAGPGMGAKPHLWILMKMKVSDGSDTTNLGFQNLEVLQRNGLKASWTMLFFIFWYIWWFFKNKRHKNDKKQRKAWFNFGMPT